MIVARPGERGQTLPDLAIRKARPSDCAAALALINAYAAKGMLLLRSESLAEQLADFSVVEGGGTIIAGGALSPLGPGLGEIRSIAVHEDHAGLGIGHTLVTALFDQARERGFEEVLALTTRVSFFEALGFKVSKRERFIDKLKVDCAACPLDLCCYETAVVKPVASARARDAGLPHHVRGEEYT